MAKSRKHLSYDEVECKSKDLIWVVPKRMKKDGSVKKSHCRSPKKGHAQRLREKSRKAALRVLDKVGCEALEGHKWIVVGKGDLAGKEYCRGKVKKSRKSASKKSKSRKSRSRTSRVKKADCKGQWVVVKRDGKRGKGHCRSKSKSRSKKSKSRSRSKSASKKSKSKSRKSRSKSRTSRVKKADCKGTWVKGILKEGKKRRYPGHCREKSRSKKSKSKSRSKKSKSKSRSK
jgi:hypothetical protein